MEKTIDASVETTRFVNIDNKDFEIYTNGKLVFSLKPSEEKTMVLYVAQVGAKHLVDRILQNEGIKNSLADTPNRKSLFAKILPDLAEEKGIKPLSQEEEKIELSKLLLSQRELESSFKEKDDEKDKRIKELEDKVNQLIIIKGRKK